MARIICLANSRKNRNRCIAGLTRDGVWIRPVSTLADGAITRSMRDVDGKEPKLLDILSIPLEADGPDFGHQPENRLLKPGPWTRLGVVGVADVEQFCETRKLLLHTDSDRVPELLIAAKSADKRRSLQLIAVANAQFYRTTSYTGKDQVRASFRYAGRGYDIVVTDPIVEQRVRKGEKLSRDCILTVSMGGPYDGNYFKFIAAVIECT